MKVVLQMLIRQSEQERSTTIGDIIKKEYNSNIIPHRGDIIDEIPWFDDEYNFEVQKVRINYEKDLCYVVLSDKEVDSIEELKKLVEDAQLNNWKRECLALRVNG